MHILMISPIPIFPTNVGDRVRIWQLAKGLATYFELTLLLPTDEQTKNWHSLVTGHDIPNLSILPVESRPHHALKRLRSLLSSWPYHVALRYREALAQSVKELVSKHTYHLIYCHQIYTLPYLVAGSSIPAILDQHNVDRMYWQRQVDAHQNSPILKWIIRRNLEKTIRFEMNMLPLVSGIVSVSEADRLETRQYADSLLSSKGAKRPHFFVAPNGADIEHYRFREPLGTSAGRESDSSQLVLGFLGSMDLKLNQDAALTLIQEIYPAVQQQLPDKEVSVLIIGRNPPRQLLDLARQGHITVTGTVPDILPYLHQVDILVLPLQSGAGSKLRVLEAMSAGVCVVGSPLALVGAGLTTSTRLANNHEEFVHAICQLAQNPKSRHKMVLEARQLVTERYSWEHITSQLAQKIKITYCSKKGI